MTQTIQITWLNLLSIPTRIGPSLVICVGIAGVVAVLISVLAMANGLTDSVVSAGHPDRAIVLRNGAVAESLSSVSRDASLAVDTAPGVASDAQGRLTSPEVVLSVNLEQISASGIGAVTVRGLTPNGLRLRQEIEVMQGRLFEAGRYEAVVGRLAQQRYAGLTLGERVDFHGAAWTIVGVFTTGGDAHESGLLVDAETLMPAAQRTIYNAITVQLESPDAFDAFKAAVESDPRLQVEAKPEVEYYKGQSEQVSSLLEFVAYVVGSIMAVGALLGAINTMYSAVSARTREIATLRAIGFGALPVVISVLVEALVLAVIGALVGAGVAWILFNGSAFSTGSAFGQIAVQLKVGGAMFTLGIVWACVIGMLGGLFPAVRSARHSVVDGLRVSG